MGGCNSLLPLLKFIDGLKSPACSKIKMEAQFSACFKIVFIIEIVNLYTLFYFSFVLAFCFYYPHSVFISRKMVAHGWFCPLGPFFRLHNQREGLHLEEPQVLEKHPVFSCQMPSSLDQNDQSISSECDWMTAACTFPLCAGECGLPRRHVIALSDSADPEEADRYSCF